MKTPDISSSNQSSYLSSWMPTGSQVLSNVCKVALPIIALAVVSNLPGASAITYGQCVQDCLRHGGDGLGCALVCAVYR